MLNGFWSVLCGWFASLHSFFRRLFTKPKYHIQQAEEIVSELMPQSAEQCLEYVHGSQDSVDTAMFRLEELHTDRTLVITLREQDYAILQKIRKEYKTGSDAQTVAKAVRVLLKTLDTMATSKKKVVPMHPPTQKTLFPN